MKQTLKIKEVRDKTTKEGKPFGVVVTNKGGYVCFDNNLINGLKAQIGKTGEFETIETNDRKKITGLMPDENNDSEEIPEEQVINPSNEKKKLNLKGVSPSFYVGSAEKIFKTLYENDNRKDIITDDAYRLELTIAAIDTASRFVEHFTGGGA